MSAKSWDHRVILLPPRRLDQAQSCSVRCPSPVTYMTSYRYVTGQYGRTTTARRQVCTEHATRFAARHGLAMPTEPSPVEPRLLDQVVGAAVASGAWPMWAQRRSDLPDGRQFLNVVDDRRTAEMYGRPVVPVQVVEDADGTYWGWVYNDDEPGTNRHPRGGVPQMIQPTEGMFSMQFPYGPKVERDRGRGRIVRLSVYALDEEEAANGR